MTFSQRLVGLDRWVAARKIGIGDIANRYNIFLRRGSNRCPFPDHQDKHPSFVLNEAKNTFKCFGCDRYGSSIDFLAALSGLTPSQSVALILDAHLPSTVVAAPERSLHRAASSKPTSPNPELYSHLLKLCPLKGRGKVYLSRRCITPKTAEAFSVGYLSDSANVFRTLIEAWSHQTLHQAGLSVPGKYGNRFIFQSETLLFPFFDNGAIIYVQGRALTESQHATRWMGLRGVPKPIYNSSAITSRTMYVCEGVMDVLSAAEFGYNAIGLLGAGDALPEHLLRDIRGNTIYLVGDLDAPGQSFNKKIAAQLSKRSIPFKIQRVPVGNDINDYLIHVRKRDG